MRIALALALALAVAAVAVAVAPAASSSTPVLVARVGLHDGYTIGLAFPNGRKVRSLPAGTYTIVVHDYSKIHNFALGSQTQNRRLFTTGIPWVGTRKYTVKLVPGSYAYACSAHFRTMNGTFVVK
jgi:hypothetical protein